MIAFPGSDGRTVELPPLALGTLVDRIAGVRMFQVVQTAPDRLAVRLTLDEATAPGRIWEEVHRALRGLLDGHGLAGVTVERGPQPPARTAGGKFPTVYPEVRKPR